MSAARRPPVQAERTLLAEVLLRLRCGRWPVIPIATPNGLHIPARTDDERAVKARMINRMRGDGMMIAGAPDLVLLWPGGGGFIELKRPGGRALLGYQAPGQPSPDQVEFARRCGALGINHAYCSSWGQVEGRLAAWGLG